MVELSDLEILSLEMKNFHLQQQSRPVPRNDDNYCEVGLRAYCEVGHRA